MAPSVPLIEHQTWLLWWSLFSFSLVSYSHYVIFSNPLMPVIICGGWATTLLPGLGPLFFGILRGSAWVWACCRASRWTQLEGSLPLVRPGPALGRPGPAKASSSHPALFAQPNCKENVEKTQRQEELTFLALRLHNDNGICNRKQDVAHCVYMQPRLLLWNSMSCLISDWLYLAMK